MDILLTTINSKYIHTNLAIRILFEMNKSHEGLVWKEFNLKDDLNQVAVYCSKKQIVAFSCYIWNIKQIIKLTSIIKQLNPECKILMGGPEVSFEWDSIINLKSVDFIIIGEGEIAFSQFIKHYPNLEFVPSLIWKNHGKIVVNKMADPYRFVDEKLCSPYSNELSVDDLYHKICYIEASRGCPAKCSFCLAGLDNKLRFLPIVTICRNLQYVMQYGKIIKFLDRTFNANQKFAISIFRFIIDNHKPGNIFQFEIKADQPQRGLIDFIRQYVPKNLFRFEIGIQTINQKANDAIQRKQNFENIKYFIKQIEDIIEIHLDLIVGLPHDYYEDIKNGFDYVFKLFAPELQLGFLKLLKGTPIRSKYFEHEYYFDSEQPYQIRKSKYLSEDELFKIQKVEQTLEIYWNKKRTILTLKYIAKICSIFDFFLGLGNFFSIKINKTGYSLMDIYEIIFDYTTQVFSNNLIVRQLIAIDYYLQHKVKPRIMFVDEVEKSVRNKIILENQLNIHKYRYTIIPLDFDFKIFEKDSKVIESKEYIIIKYDGHNKPQIIDISE